MPDPVWVGSVTVRAGDHHVGVRTDDVDVLARLRRRYEDRLVDEDRGELDLAIVVGSRLTGAGTDVLHLLHGRRPIMRSRHVARVLHRVDAELSALHGASSSAHVPLVGFAGLIGSAGAVLVPTGVVDGTTVIERIAQEQELGLAESPGLAIDAHGRLVVPQRDASEGWAGAAVSGAHVVRVVCLELAGAPAGRMRAVAAGRLLAHADVAPNHHRTAVAALGRLSEHATIVDLEARLGPSIAQVSRLLAGGGHGC